MTNTQAIFLGLIQGLTEYLPVSSSAHLVLVPKFLGWQFHEQEAFVFDVLVQLGTLVGVFAYFMAPIEKIIRAVFQGLKEGRPFYYADAKIGYLIVLATIPAGICGLVFKDFLAKTFSSPLASCYCLIITGLLLLAAEYLGRIIKENPSKKDALFIGVAQSFALLPGISRSGATIAAGMYCGLARKDAAYFSFLMSIPVMVAASLLASVELLNDQALIKDLAMPIFLGFITAAGTGYVVIKWFMSFLAQKRLIWFAAYCFMVGLAGILLWSF